MKIKRIQVKNIGPYVNENAFDFDVSDITKRMVLIGGKNGAGKTTLFNAIKICLEADNLIAQRVECAEDEYREISNEILIIDQRLASLEKAYAKGGGISKKEWRSMQDQIAKEDVRREGHHKWLKADIINTFSWMLYDGIISQTRRCEHEK